MKTEITVQQAIVMYTTIEALGNQFDRENRAAGRPLRPSKRPDAPDLSGMIKLGAEKQGIKHVHHEK